MYCTVCRKEFQPHKDRRGCEVSHACPECHEKRLEHKGGSFVNRDTYCIRCGKVLDKYPKRVRGGRIVMMSTARRFCKECKQKDRAERRGPVFCKTCGKDISGLKRKYCEECVKSGRTKRKGSAKERRKARVRSSTKWAESHPEKIKAQHLAKYCLDRVSVLYECPCKHKRKHMHHFDYSRPYEVLMLCPSCHAAEHKRLRGLAERSDTPKPQPHALSGPSGHDWRVSRPESETH